MGRILNFYLCHKNTPWDSDKDLSLASNFKGLGCTFFFFFNVKTWEENSSTFPQDYLSTFDVNVIVI